MAKKKFNSIKYLIAFVHGVLACLVFEPIFQRVTGAEQTKSVESAGTSSCPTTATTHGATSFDQIVDTESEKALKINANAQANRNKFDIDFWEQRSELTTTGGLRREDRILLASIYSNATSVFEFGLGESTYLANHLGVPRYAGIDSDAVWVTGVRDKVSPHFRFYFADVGKTREWGRPVEGSLKKNVWDYQLAPLHSEPLPFDVYLVDGRWRMACALASFLHASARGAPHEQTKVLIHDCKTKPIQREAYNRGDHLLDLLQHSGHALCVFQRKPTTTDEALLELWKVVANDSSRR